MARLVPGDKLLREVQRTRVTVVQRDRDLGRRVQTQLAQLADVSIEVVDTFAPTARPGDGDVVVLDLSAVIPQGYKIVRVLQSRGAEPPLVILRAAPAEGAGAYTRANRPDRVVAIEARLHAAVGRSSHKSWLPLTYAGAFLRADLPGNRVTVHGRQVPLSAREAELLGILLTHVNRVVAREVLISEIWGFETRSLDVHIRRLRRKLGLAGQQIETIPAFGYRFVEPRNEVRVSEARSASLATPVNLLHLVNAPVTE